MSSIEEGFADVYQDFKEQVEYLNAVNPGEFQGKAALEIPELTDFDGSLDKLTPYFERLQNEGLDPVAVPVPDFSNMVRPYWSKMFGMSYSAVPETGTQRALRGSTVVREITWGAGVLAKNPVLENLDPRHALSDNAMRKISHATNRHSEKIGPYLCAPSSSLYLAAQLACRNAMPSPSFDPTLASPTLLNDNLKKSGQPRNYAEQLDERNVTYDEYTTGREPAHIVIKKLGFLSRRADLRIGLETGGLKAR